MSDTLKLPPLEWLRHREQTCRTCVPDTEPSHAVASAIADKYAECATELTTLRAQVAGLEERYSAVELERRVLCDALMVIESMHPDATPDSMRKWAKERRTESIVRLDAALAASAVKEPA